MEQFVLVIHIIVCIALIGLILIQQGKGAEVGASFGSGASQTIFGSQGAASFVTRATAILVILFFTTSLALGYLATVHNKPQDIDELMKKFGSDKEITYPLKEEDVPKIPEQKNN